MRDFWATSAVELDKRLAVAEMQKAALIAALDSAASWLEWLDDPRCNLGDTHKAVIKQARATLKEVEETPKQES
jgi:hypothetical protein